MIRARHIRMGARFLAHRFHALHPYEVQALLLNACNLKCVYCRCPELKTSLLTTQQWRDIIRGLAALGTIRIKFQGGEPTLRTDFCVLAEEAQRAGMITAVITNGLKVVETPELLDHIDEAVFSLDAVNPEIHDRLRGQGTHAQVVQAIDIARQRGLITAVVMVVNCENVGEIEPMLSFCESRGVYLHAQPVLFGRDSFDATGAGLALTTEQVRAMHVQLAAWKHQGRRLMFSARTYQGVAEWDDYGMLTTRSDGPSSCMAGTFYVHIEPNGDVWPCSQHGASITPRNIIRDGLRAALQHVQRHDCGSCFTAYLNERKAVFGLRPAALLEVARRR